jgi:hypothetical protein
MSNTAHFWTPDEDAAVVTIPFEDFNAIYPDISWNAFRFRKARLLKDQKAMTPVVRTVEKGFGPSDFIGLTMGYFDIESTFSTQPRVLCASVADAWGGVDDFALAEVPNYPNAIVRPGVNWLDDGPLVGAYIDRLNEFDVVVSWFGKGFDVDVLNGRVAYHNQINGTHMPFFLPRLHIDAMYLAGRGSMKIGRRSLESVSTFFGTANHKTGMNPQKWDRADHGDMAEYADVVDHCHCDVLVTRDTFSALKGRVLNIHR